MMDPASKLITEAFNLGLLEIEYVPELRGASNLDGYPMNVPPQVVLKARVGGVLVRLHSRQIGDLVPTARVVQA